MSETKIPSTDLAPPNLDALKKLIEDNEGPFAIVTAQLDPDSIGAGVLVRKLLAGFGKTGLVYYAGSKDRDPQNQTAFTVCKLASTFRPKKELPKGMPIILIDSATLNDTRWGEEKLEPIIVIDHHDSLLPRSPERWVWIEPRFGAASTMVARLLQIFGINLTEDERETATLGAFGIYNDTRGLLSKTTSIDREMFTELMRIGDQRLLEDLHEFPLPEAYYAFLATAYETKQIYQAKLVATVGEISAHDNTLLARVATKLVRWDGVHTVILWALQDSEMVVVKARTIDRSLDLNDLLQRHFPGCSGTKGHEGGADIPVPIIAPKTPKSREAFVLYLRNLFNEMFGASGS